VEIKIDARDDPYIELGEEFLELPIDRQINILYKLQYKFASLITEAIATRNVLRKG